MTSTANRAQFLENAIRDLISESVFILRNAPLPDGKFKRFERAIQKAKEAILSYDEAQQ